MGKPGTNSPYEQIRLARIQENKRRLATLGVERTLTELKSLASATKPEKTHIRKLQKVEYSSTPLRRSSRLRGDSCHSEESLEALPFCPSTPPIKATNTSYEQIRQARIEENKIKLATLGVQKALSELKSLAPEKPPVRKCQKIDYSSAPLRRSTRVRGSCCYSEKALKARSSTRGRIQGVVKVCTGPPEIKDSNHPRWLAIDQGNSCYSEKPKKALPFCPSTPTIKEKGSSERFSPEALSRRCTSKGRGSLYDPTYGICCHFCRQKKLCGEEDCKHCGDLDLDQPCIGKTDCSICHSSTGVMCRACLSIRYGEELEEVRANKQWACPHCIEEEGIRPNWICNSSLCLRRRKMVPTGIAIFTARKMGYKSVAHLLMDKLKQERRQRRCDEEDCKPCDDFYGEQPCIIGKTECSICHSSTGIFCRDCLKVRYGEELAKVRADKKWACPHCIEEKGTKPYWICNSSICLQKRKMAFDETAIYGARRRMGYKSVAHLLIYELKKDGWIPMMPRSVLNRDHENT